MTEPATGGALGMREGEHFLRDSREKFYTIGRARYQPFPIDKSRPDVDFLANSPMPSHVAYDLLSEFGGVPDVDTFRETWKAKVLANVIAHSNLHREPQDARHAVYTWDVKLMAQMPKRQHSDLDINGDLTKVEYIERLRKLRMALTMFFEPDALQVMFDGWIDLKENNVTDPSIGNPYMRPFDDMTLSDLEYSDKFPLEFKYVHETGQGMFMYFGALPDDVDDITGITFTTDLTGGKTLDVELTPESMIRMSAFRAPHSKMLDASRLQHLAESAQLFVTGSAFAFVDGPRIVAYGWTKTSDAKRLIRAIAEERGSTLEVLVPNAAPAKMNGKQDCLEHAWIDLDLLKFWVKHYNGKVLYELPPLVDEHISMTRKKKRSKYAMMYEAARGSRRVHHEICPITKTPHEFVVGIHVEL